MYITNLWGVTFSFIMPTLMLILGAYIAGKEEGRNKYARASRVRYRKNNSRNTYTKRANSTKHYRNR